MSKWNRLAKVIYEDECVRIGHRANCWPTHEEEAIAYWEDILRLGDKAWWKKQMRKLNKKKKKKC